MSFNLFQAYMKTYRRHHSPVKSMSIDNNESNNILDNVANNENLLSTSNGGSNDYHCINTKECDQDNLLSVENSSISDKVGNVT